MTLLDSATEDDSVFVRCPRSKIEDVAAEVITSKLDKLRRVEAIMKAAQTAWDQTDTEILDKIQEVFNEDSDS